MTTLKTLANAKEFREMMGQRVSQVAFFPEELDNICKGVSEEGKELMLLGMIPNNKVQILDACCDIRYFAAQFPAYFGRPDGSQERSAVAEILQLIGKCLNYGMNSRNTDAFMLAWDITDILTRGLTSKRGLPLAEAEDLVHSANLAKRQPDGSILRNEHGKVMKPEGWVAPDAAIAELVLRTV